MYCYLSVQVLAVCRNSVQTEESILSYQSDKAKMEQSVKQQKELMFFVVRITVIILAVAFLALAVCFAVFELGKNPSEDELPTGEMPTLRPSGEVTDGCIYAVFGETLSYKKYVTFTGGELSVDASKVDTTKEGTYPVTYTVKSPSGRTVSITLNLVWKKATYTREALDTLLEKQVVPKLGISSNMSIEQKVKKIYSYVNSSATIRFVNESNIPNINRSNWQTDWLEEAYRSIETGSGDCYSYYSLSKALFEYYNIENRGVRRDESRSNESGTHFWQVVNIGTASAPRWYFFDATRLAGTFSDGTRNGCLRTAEELNSYKPSKEGIYGFYAYSKAGLPTLATTPISR